jgi:circadian clock protein KaiC
MSQTMSDPKPDELCLPKCPTGIKGLDEITYGGLPRGRPTLICGAAGCCKTLFGMEFLIRGAVEFDEPGVFIAFEESPQELAMNVRSLGFDVDALIDQNKVAIDYIRIERNEIEETGDYDLEGLFIRLAYAVDSIGAKRIVFDTIETLFGSLDNSVILRSELRRLFHWIKSKGLTAIVTAERGAGQLTRNGLEEYVSDCVILLDHRVIEQISTRRLRVVKYRGSQHGTNEYPFIIEPDGLVVLPITSVEMSYAASTDRISTGISRLDEMLGGSGFFRDSSVLLSGTSGTGKTTFAAHFADATCRRQEPCLLISFEQSPKQMIRDMRSVGLDLEKWVDQKRLRLIGVRSTMHGVETHLSLIHKWIDDFKPRVVIVDPISSLLSIGSPNEARSMAMRLIDTLKSREIACLFTNLSGGGNATETTEIDLSSLIDTWLLLRDIEFGGERNCGVHVLKSRGMAHSNQIREFLITNAGIELLDVSTGANGVLTGSARLAQEALERAAALSRSQELDRKRRDLERKRRAIEARIALMRAGFEADDEELSLVIAKDQTRESLLLADLQQIAISRKVGESTISGTTVSPPN